MKMAFTELYLAVKKYCIFLSFQNIYAGIEFKILKLFINFIINGKYDTTRP